MKDGHLERDSLNFNHEHASTSLCSGHSQHSEEGQTHSEPVTWAGEGVTAVASVSGQTQALHKEACVLGFSGYCGPPTNNKQD